MQGARLNSGRLNSERLNNSQKVPYSIYSEARRLRDSKPLTKIEYIDTLGVITDVTAYFLSGAEFEQIKERAPDEIQAGSFDIVLSNQDNKFSEFDSSSLIYNAQYHGARIRVSEGFILPDGSTTYQVQQVGYIDQLTTDSSTSQITFRCRDLIRVLLDQSLHSRPSGEVPVMASANIGSGVCSSIETKPFKTKNEDWTLTCTLGGADGVATFSVVGSVSGSVGTATSGTQFSTAAGVGGIRFTITAGSTVWSSGDVITFSTKQYPEWSGVNAGKIIWAALTGYNWDTNTAEAWSGQVLSFDHTQSDLNTQLDYDAFAAAITDIDSIGFFSLTGYAAYDTNAKDFFQSLILLFLGSIFTAPDGRISINTYIPRFAGIDIRNFADSKKIRELGYTRTIDEVINWVSVAYKATSVWEFSGDSINYDGEFVALNQASITKYGYLTQGFSTLWFSTTGNHAQDFADKLIQKYAEPPLNIDFKTGLDGMFTQIGDPISVTDTKYKLTAVTGEVAKINKNFDTDPVEIVMRMRRDSDLGFNWGYIGSEIDEGDGISPQSDNFDTATDTDKLFAYFSKVADTTLVDYRMF